MSTDSHTQTVGRDKVAAAHYGILLDSSRSPFLFSAVVKVWEQESFVRRMQKPFAGVHLFKMSCLRLQE